MSLESIATIQMQTHICSMEYNFVKEHLTLRENNKSNSKVML